MQQRYCKRFTFMKNWCEHKAQRGKKDVQEHFQTWHTASSGTIEEKRFQNICQILIIFGSKANGNNFVVFLSICLSYVWDQRTNQIIVRKDRMNLSQWIYARLKQLLKKVNSSFTKSVPRTYVSHISIFQRLKPGTFLPSWIWLIEAPKYDTHKKKKRNTGRRRFRKRKFRRSPPVKKFKAIPLREPIFPLNVP